VWYVPPNQQESTSTSSSLWHPGEVVEYHAKGNVLTIAPVVLTEPPDNAKQLTTVENTASYVRRRNISNTDAQTGVMDLITMRSVFTINQSFCQ
jgi:hypothetical protein